MFKFIEQCLCRHTYRRRRVIYGDEIIGRNGMRSEWVCTYCDKVVYSNNPFTMKKQPGVIESL